MQIIKFDSTVNTTVCKNRKIEYIVVHYTAGISSKEGSALATAKYFAKGNVKASSDFIIDDKTVIQYNTDLQNRYSWHCGGSKLKNSNGGKFYKECTNANSIGVELCSTSYTGKVEKPNSKEWYFTTFVENNATKLIAELMYQYNIDINHVIRHYDVTGKNCPAIIGWNIDSGHESYWLDFKESLNLEYKDIVIELLKKENERLVNDKEKLTTDINNIKTSLQNIEREIAYIKNKL